MKIKLISKDKNLAIRKHMDTFVNATMYTNPAQQ
jgi:hypothetical protein